MVTLQGWLTSVDGSCGLNWRRRLLSTKSSKIAALARHPHLEHVIATGSSDRKLKLWDLRKLSGTDTAKPQALDEWSFNSGINSVSWSPCGGHRLLVTLQQREIAVLDQPRLSLRACQMVTVPHMHRFYMHITPFRATWHPTSDRVFALGRWPETKGGAGTHGIDLFTVGQQASAGDSDANPGSNGETGLRCEVAGRMGTDVEAVQGGGCAWSPDGAVLASLTGHSVVVYACE